MQQGRRVLRGASHRQYDAGRRRAAVGSSAPRLRGITRYTHDALTHLHRLGAAAVAQRKHGTVALENGFLCRRGAGGEAQFWCRKVVGLTVELSGKSVLEHRAQLLHVPWRGSVRSTGVLPPPLCPARLTLVQQRGGQLRQRRGGGRCGRGVHRIVAALCGVGVRLGGRLRRRRRRGKVFDALQRQLAGVRHLLAGVLSVCGRVGVGGGEGGHKAGEGGWLLVGALADGMLVTQDGVRRHACVHRRGRTAAISPASLRQPPLQPTCRCSRSGCRHSSVPIAPRASPASCRTLHIGHNGRVDVRCWPASADASRWRRPPCCNLSISCSGGCCRPAPPPRPGY